MIFKVGDTVVYPHHGAALIEAIETRTIKGEPKEYLVLKVAQGDLTVRVLADNAEYVGVRDVVGQEGLDKVFQVLRAPHTEEPTNWSRRYKANLEKLASGDVNKVAEGSSVTCGAAIRSAVCPPARRGCWPRHGRSSSASWRWPRTPTMPRPQPSSTRFWPPRREGPLKGCCDRYGRGRDGGRFR